MNKIIVIVLYTLSIGSLIISTIWMIKSNYDFEPILCVIASLIGLLVGYKVNENAQKNSIQKINVKGNENFVRNEMKDTNITINKK